MAETAEHLTGLAASVSDSLRHLTETGRGGTPHAWLDTAGEHLRQALFCIEETAAELPAD